MHCASLDRPKIKSGMSGSSSNVLFFSFFADFPKAFKVAFIFSERFQESARIDGNFEFLFLFFAVTRLVLAEKINETTKVPRVNS